MWPGPGIVLSELGIGAVDIIGSDDVGGDSGRRDYWVLSLNEWPFEVLDCVPDYFAHNYN
jgi:hypothetical protein